jgi:secondary thiamine-phosphate synthase enzyme
MPATAEAGRASVARQLTISIETREAFEFVDLTPVLSALVGSLAVSDGLLTVHTRHTTTGLMINEHEPMLLSDLKALFERLVPASDEYGHDDFTRRTVNLGPCERRNGHAHCRAALLRTSESVPIVDGALGLGRWQRIFLVEFDGAQRRLVSVTISGTLRDLRG